MDKYVVYLSPKAYRDLDEIYEYICENLLANEAAKRTVSAIEQAILSLGYMPYRGAERKVGIYANKGYRQLFINNYIVVYRIDEETDTVIVITVKYIHQNF